MYTTDQKHIAREGQNNSAFQLFKTEFDDLKKRRHDWDILQYRLEQDEFVNTELTAQEFINKNIQIYEFESAMQRVKDMRKNDETDKQ